MLKIGQIEYANCTPLFHVLREQFNCSEYEFISGVPADLNSMLLTNKIDVCPSSSIEYAYHPDRYSILPQLSISSIGAVASVLLFSRVPIADLDGRLIRLSSESATSVNLLKILIRQRYGLSCTYEIAPSASTDSEDSSSALLLIGDSALRRSFEKSAPFVYDLGELWHSWTGYPFVFALWLCRIEIAEEGELKKLSHVLLEAKECVSGQLEQIATVAKETSWMGRTQLLAYWRDNISYHLDEQAKVGLMLYYTKCFECGLIDTIPSLRFVA
ncbi:MAG: menaquinone biosynthetic enzyme MqnA/MqnD family protein [Desulfuromonadaceae bacterium]